MQIKYFAPIRTGDGLTISVDMLTIDYHVGNPASRDKLAAIMDALPIRYAVHVKSWESFKMGRFRANYTVKLNDGSSFFVGMALNSVKPLWGRCRLEFNPNKTIRHEVLLFLLGWFNEHCSKVSSSVRRFDLAVDISVDRFDVRLIKDRRVYSERRHGQEWTEYLGPKSSTVGRCKLYNKAAEAGLTYSLTRLELTLDPDTPYDEIPWPKVYYIDTRQIGLNETRLTDTQRFVLGALMEGYGTLNDLGRKTREKLGTYLNSYCKWVTVSEADYAQIRGRLRAILEYPLTPLDVGTIIPDQPPKPLPEFPAWVQEAEQGPAEQLF